MGSPRRDPPPPPPPQPATPAALAAALRTFTAAFVVPDKRAQLEKRLGTRERREETLVTLSRWLAGSPAPLAGADRSPAGLRARLGDLVGIHLDIAGAQRVTIAQSLVAGRDRAAVWIADTGRVALVSPGDGTALLCTP